MKKLLVLLFAFFICTSVFASDYRPLPYKNIKEGSKIAITESDTWTQKVRRKDENIYIRRGELLSLKNNSKNISTNCNYLFIINGRLVGYSDKNLKFYEFIPKFGRISKSELGIKDIAPLFKDFRIIFISDFSSQTNVYKFWKKRSAEKIMILNDTEKEFNNYGFTTNNAKFEKYEINNAICITKKGMIQFSKFGENTGIYPWFILLVR